MDPSNKQPPGEGQIGELQSDACRDIGQEQDLPDKFPSALEPRANDPPTYALDTAYRIDPINYPHQPAIGGGVPTTIPNVAHLIQTYGISARYDVIRKKLRITLPTRHPGTVDNADNIAIAQIISLAALNGLAFGQVPAYLEAIGDRNQYNPVADWIMSRPWDGVDRLTDFIATLVQKEDYPEELKRILLYRWLLSGVAAALKPSGFRCRGVLTLQGPQSIGKTAWVSALVPDEVLREAVIKLDHHLDASNKDSILTAIGHWIVEIGELDSSFKKDIARLKGILTADRDQVRRPYARTDSEYPRRTIFCATVNDDQFLPDMTGNTRWWTIPVVKVNYEHGIDMQQLFAKLAVDYHAGKQWWLTREEELQLEDVNKEHRVVSVIRDRVLAYLNLERKDEDKLPAMTATELLREIGIDHPSNPQAKECAAVLREVLGPPKKIQGQYKWKIPRKPEDPLLDLDV